MKILFNIKLNILSLKETFQVFIFAFFSSNLFAQNINLPFEFYHHQTINSQLIHSSIQPIQESIQLIKDTSLKDNQQKRVSKFGKKWFNESLLHVNEEDVQITADPLFNFSLSKYNDDYDFRYYSNVRGFRVKANIGSKVSFESRFYENQFFYPDYLASRAAERQVAIGIGRSKPFKLYGFDAGLANGYLSFSPIKNINFQLGHGRNFFGNGYRSLLLSDYAPDYAYISGQYLMKGGKVMYKHINGWMNTLTRTPYSSTPEALFKPKVANFNILSFKPNNDFELSFFEGLVYKKYDDIKGIIRPDLGFFVPLIGKGVLISDSNSSNNVIYGFNFSYQPSVKLMFYNQLAIQSENRIGVQFGLKWLSFLKLDNSFLCVEFNRIARDLYAIDSVNSIQRYSHLSHELAHPLGAGFNELLVKGMLEQNNYFLRFGGNYANVDYHPDMGWANNVMNSKEHLKPPESKIRLMIISSSIGYRFNKATRMELSFGFLYRKQDLLDESYLTITWRTFLKNDYFDQ